MSTMVIPLLRWRSQADPAAPRQHCLRRRQALYHPHHPRLPHFALLLSHRLAQKPTTPCTSTRMSSTTTCIALQILRLAPSILPISMAAVSRLASPFAMLRRIVSDSPLSVRHRALVISRTNSVELCRLLPTSLSLSSLRVKLQVAHPWLLELHRWLFRVLHPFPLLIAARSPFQHAVVYCLSEARLSARVSLLARRVFRHLRHRLWQHHCLLRGHLHPLQYGPRLHGHWSL